MILEKSDFYGQPDVNSEIPESSVNENFIYKVVEMLVKITNFDYEEIDSETFRMVFTVK